MNKRYGKFWLVPKAYKVTDAPGWAAKVHIVLDLESEAIATPITVPGTFQTEQVALEAALAYGKKSIDKAIRDEDIHSVIEQETKLPATSRRAYGSESDDVATDGGGKARRVPSPGNPEDRF